MTAWELIQKAMKGGFKTSEFWVAVLSLLLPYIVAPIFDKLDPIVQQYVVHSGWVGGLVAAVYVAVRGYVKGQTVKSEAVYPAAVSAMSLPYNPDPESLASAREGEAAGVPPRATGGNIGGYPSR